MSLLNRINKKSQPPKPESLLEQMVRNMQEDKTLQAHIDQLLKDNDLSPAARQELKTNPVDFLVRDMNLIQKKTNPLALLIEEIGKQLDSPTRGFTPESFRQHAKPIFDFLIREFKLQLSSEEQQNLWEGVVSEYVGFGPLDKLIADGSIHDIVVMGYQAVYLRKHEAMERIPNGLFKDDFQYKRIIDRIFPYSEDEMKLPVRFTNISRNVVAFCLYQDVEYMNPVLIIHKNS